MATVYFGRALAVGGFQRLVAIKYLHPHLLKDAQFVRMFLDEGRLAAGILHPNVVATLDLEHTEDGLYIVMEYIEGDQLLGMFRNARAAGKRIPFGVTLRVALDTLNGLHAAHELCDDAGNPLRIVHRDVSPHNILVGTDGIGRITDFGIAKAEERISDTREGIVKGKLSYMSPEQTGDGPIDRRADVFSAATVLWECLTGRRLFPGRTDGEVLKNLLQNPIPRLRDIDPDLPQSIDDILARALSRDVVLRQSSAHELAEALESAATPTLGIAPTRLVSRYVREMASAKVSEEQRLRKAHPTQNLPVYRPPPTPSQVRSLSLDSPQGEDGPTQVKSQARGAEASSTPSLPAPPALGAPSLIPSVPPATALLSTPPPEKPREGAYPSEAITEELPVIDLGGVTEVLLPEVHEPSPARSVMVFVMVLVLGTLAGTSIFYVLDGRGHRSDASSNARSAPPEPVSVVVAPQPPAALVAHASTPDPEATNSPRLAPESAPPQVVAPTAQARSARGIPRAQPPRAAQPALRAPHPAPTRQSPPLAPTRQGAPATPEVPVPSAGPPPLPTAI